MLGVLTGVGGGRFQALLLGEVPIVLREHIYASAALLGAAAMVVGVRRGGAPARMMALGGVLLLRPADPQLLARLEPATVG